MRPFTRPSYVHAMRVAIAASLAWAVPSMAVDAEGRGVAASCATCHGTNGASVTALPSLAGMPRDELVAKMRAYKAGTRAGTLMPQLAKGYTDEQIDHAAAFFAAQPLAVRRP